MKMRGMGRRRYRYNISADAPKMSFKHILKNNLYMLKIIHREDKRLIPLRVLVMVLSTVTGFLTGTYLLKYALNAVGEGKSFYEVITFVIALVVIQMIIHVGDMAFWYFYNDRRYYEISKKINSDLFEKAKDVELACYENPEFYDDFVKGIAEADNRAFAVLNNMINLFATLLRLVLSVSLVISIHPVFLIFSLIPLLTIPIKHKIQKESFERDNRIREIDRKKGYPHRIFYVADYAKELRLTNIGTYLLKYLKESSDICRKIHRERGGMIAAFEILAVFLVDILAVSLTTVCAVYRTVVTKVMGYGDCLVVLNVSSQISSTLLNSTNVFSEAYSNALYIENLRKFMEYEIKMVDGDKQLPGDGDIVFDNVSFRYDGAEGYTLKGVSMRFPKNQKVAIVGANGAGKSTIVKLLLRLYDCSEGNITYGGEDVKSFARNEYRYMFSAVMQDFHLFALSVAENVMLDNSLEYDREKIISALKKAGIYEKIEENGGIDKIMTREFDTGGIMLSGGEGQKLAISHVYSKSNRFVILDEPSSALDPIAEYKMYETMMDACNNCGMIFISHRLSSATLADVVYLIEDGRVLESGSHRELMARRGKYAEMFERQAESYREEKSGEVEKNEK